MTLEYPEVLGPPGWKMGFHGQTLIYRLPRIRDFFVRKSRGKVGGKFTAVKTKNTYISLQWARFCQTICVVSVDMFVTEQKKFTFTAVNGKITDRFLPRLLIVKKFAFFLKVEKECNMQSGIKTQFFGFHV